MQLSIICSQVTPRDGDVLYSWIGYIAFNLACLLHLLISNLYFSTSGSFTSAFTYMTDRSKFFLRLSLTCKVSSSRSNQRLHFSLPSILIMATNLEKQKQTRGIELPILPVQPTDMTFKMQQSGSKSTNHIWQTWPFETVEVNLCFLRGVHRWLMAVKKHKLWLEQILCVIQTRFT